MLCVHSPDTELSEMALTVVLHLKGLSACRSGVNLKVNGANFYDCSSDQLRVADKRSRALVCYRLGRQAMGSLVLFMCRRKTECML